MQSYFAPNQDWRVFQIIYESPNSSSCLRCSSFDPLRLPEMHLWPGKLFKSNESVPQSSQSSAPLQRSSAQGLAAEASQANTDPELYSNNPAPFSAPVPAIFGRGQNYGINILDDGGPEADMDIVFVHGLTENAYDTWFHRDAGVHWPSELLKEDVSDSRILSFGYDADIVSSRNPISRS